MSARRARARAWPYRTEAVFFVDTTGFFRARINVGESNLQRAQTSDQHDSRASGPNGQRATGRARDTCESTHANGEFQVCPGRAYPCTALQRCNASPASREKAPW